MVSAMNQLGVEVFTPHWEFTHGLERVVELFGDKDTRGLFRGDFLCHNARELNWDEPVFHPYTIKHVGGVTVGVIGQGFPYVPVSHPARFVPGLTFGIRDGEAQRLVNELRDVKRVDVVVLLSHNGLSTDVKMAGRVRGIDVILGGHTHDGLPAPIAVGRTLVVNSGAHGKFLSRVDLDVRGGQVRAHRYKLMPVLSNYIAEDAAMAPGSPIGTSEISGNPKDDEMVMMRSIMSLVGGVLGLLVLMWGADGAAASHNADNPTKHNVFLTEGDPQRASAVLELEEKGYAYIRP
jgi:sulfur-oxidizing protein SoxB